jgi:hypothetical protein
MNRLGEDSRLPVVNIREGDIGVLLGLPIGGLLLGSLTGSDWLAIGLLLAGFTLAVAVVYAAPPQLTAWEWLSDISRYVFKRPRVTRNYRSKAAHASTDGGAVQYTPFSVDECTQDLTKVKQAWPGVDAIERTDGTMEAFIEVEPSNMDFAMSDDWMAVQQAATEFANNELDFPLTLYATTKPFPVEQLVEQLDDRLEDEDVQSNHAFEELIKEYRDKRPDDLADTQELHYYLGVEVDRIEVYERHGAEPTPGERLTEFPLIGLLFTPFVTRREELDEAELRAAMFEKLDDRITTVRSEFVDSVSGWSGRRLSTVELFVLLTEFWNGENLPEDDAEQLIRTKPALERQPREDER